MVFNKLVDELIDLLVVELKKDKNRTRVEDELLSPVIDFILEKIKPYVIGTSIFLIIIIFLISLILYLILASGKANST